MSAAVKPEKYENVMAAAIQIMESNEREITVLKSEVRKLTAQKEAIGAKCAVLQQEKNELELRLSKQILSIHATYLERIEALEESVAKLDEAQNRTGNIVSGLPRREELEALEQTLAVAIEKIGQVGRDFYAHSAKH